ncbi:Terminase small subunit [compost metagenome]
MKLTEKQKRFADYFVELGDATEAYVRAEYKVKSRDVAGVNASRLLGNAKVREYIDARIAEKDSARIAKQDEILEFLTHILRGEVKEQFPLGLGMGEQQLVKKELDGKDRIKAAELLGKRYGMWVDRQQLDGTVGVQIIDDIGGEPDAAE